MSSQASEIKNKAFMTAEELFEMPDDDYRYELIKGELIKMSPAGGRHGEVAMNLGAILRNYIKPRQLGKVFAAETGFILFRNPDTVRAPDASFISKERIPPEGTPKTFWPLAPDLAVEVISPYDRYEEIQEKLADYFRAGVRLVWIVDPSNHTIAVYRSLVEIRVLTEADTLEAGEVIPGFSCSVAEIFE